jgi:hypothetical protein
MNRETKALVTTSGKTLLVKSYLTGREMNDLKKDMYGAVKIDMAAASAGRSAINDLPATFMIDREAKLLEISVLSFDNSEKDVAARMQDLPNAEYQDALRQVSDVIQPDFQTSK